MFGLFLEYYGLLQVWGVFCRLNAIWASFVLLLGVIWNIMQCFVDLRMFLEYFGGVWGLFRIHCLITEWYKICIFFASWYNFNCIKIV